MVCGRVDMTPLADVDQHNSNSYCSALPVVVGDGAKLSPEYQA